MKILGIDEAGRGPVIGPMIICGFIIEEEKIPELKKMGVKDSKELTPKRREELFFKLEKLSDDLVVLKIQPQEIDRMVNTSNLNKMEIEKFAEIVNLTEADKVIIDAPESNTEKFRAKVMAKLDNKKTDLVTENYADSKYPVVSAASIIAKFHRDNEIQKLHKIYGNFGTGYPHDPLTIAFLKTWIEKNKEFPDCVRNSWATAENMRNSKKQKKLDSFK